MKFTLSAHPPFSLRTVIYSHGWAQLAPFRILDEGEGLAYVDRLPSGRVIEMVITETAAGVNVAVDESLNDEEQQTVAMRVTWMLGLNQEFTEFYRLAAAEPKLAQMADRAQGRLLRSPTLFEDAVKTILTTNTSWAGTIRMAAALVAQFGDPLPSDPARHAFPTPAQLAATGEETLRTETRLGYRAPYVLALAREIAAGTLDLEGLKTAVLPTPELRQKLLAIKGVGGYAVANLLMLLGRYDAIPIDSWARKMVSHEWYGGEPVDSAAVEAAFADWGEWRGLAYWFWDWSYSAGD